MTTQWKLIDVLREAVLYLQTHEIENPRLNAERLLAHGLGLTRVDLYLQFEKPLQTEEREAYKQLLRRRSQREPLQYIIGETEFMSLPFKVAPGVLIPRPETELLVERAIGIAKDTQKRGRSLRILDIGTGSGCIAVSLAKVLPGAQIDAVDNSMEALDIAKENAQRHQTDEQIAFRRVDILKENWPAGTDRFDIIVSNPPYIQSAEIGRLEPEVWNYEPRNALNGGDDGLMFYRRFRDVLPPLLNRPGAVLLEIGEDQGSAVRQILNDGSWISVEICKDLAGRDRVAILNR